MSQTTARVILWSLLVAGSLWTLYAFLLWGPGYGTSDSIRRAFVMVPPLREALLIAVLALCCQAAQCRWYDVVLIFALGTCAGHIVWP